MLRVRALTVLSALALVMAGVVAPLSASPIVLAVGVADLPVDPLLQLPTNICGASGVGEVTLSWDAPTDVNVTGHVVQFQEVGAAAWTDGPAVASQTSVSVPGTNGTRYRYRVASTSDAGNRSEWGSFCMVQWGNGVGKRLPQRIAAGVLANETVTQVSIDYFRACARTASGKLSCWSPLSTPVLMSGGVLDGTTVTQVSVGGEHACAVLANGTVACWGNNGYGQLGDGTTTVSASPVVVSGGALTGKTAVAVATGLSGTCALTSDGLVACWGYMGLSNSSVPVAMNGGDLAGEVVRSVHFGWETVCAVTVSDKLVCWGRNMEAQISFPKSVYISTPTWVHNGALAARGVLAAASGSDMINGHTCAVTTDHTLACMGTNQLGQLGTGSKVASLGVPVDSAAGALSTASVVAVDTTSTSTCALSATGDVICFGDGQYVDGIYNYLATTPTQVTGGALIGGGLQTFSMGGDAILGVWSGVGAPGQVPSVPFNVTASSFGLSPTVSWSASLLPGASAITGYEVQGSTDGGRTYPLSWSFGDVTSGPVTVPRDDYYRFRVVAHSAAGASLPSLPSPELLVKTEVRTTKANVKVVFSTPESHAVVGATVNWQTTDGVSSSVGSFVTDANGAVVFPVISTGPVTFGVAGGTVGSPAMQFGGQMTTVVLRNGSVVNITTPSEPTIVSRSVTVKMPDNSVVPDTALSLSGGVAGSTDTGVTTNLRSFSASWTYPAASLPTTSGSTGTATYVGFDVPSTGRDVTGTFSDGVIQQVAYASLTSPSTTMLFEQLPVVQVITSEPSPLDPGTGTTVTVQAIDGVGDPIQGATLTLSAPASRSAAVIEAATSGCTSKLAGNTAANGQVTFTVCPKTTAAWRADGTNIVASKPLTVRVKPAPAQVTAGTAHSCSKVADNTVRCWGANANGQLGTGTLVGSSIPVAVPGLSSVSSVAAGGAFNCVVTTAGPSGKVKCWGQNANGQLGDGTRIQRTAPVQVTTAGVTPLSGVSKVSAGAAFACAVLSPGAAGTARCWGANASGQLGNGATADQLRPVSVKSNATTALRGVVTISGGGASACALMSTGSVRCWGANSYGQLGNGTTTASRYPVGVSGIDGVHAKATGIAVGDGFACATISGGSVRCWGRNDLGQLGNGASTASRTPTIVKVSATSNLSAAASIAAGGGHACAVVGSGATARVRCWGANGSGQIGDATTTARRLAVLLSSTSLTGVKNIACGGQHTVAVVPSAVRLPSAAATWGRNASGQLGLSGTVNRSSPATLTKL